MNPTVLSLFAGVGGLDLGFEANGCETRWYSEIDPYACKVMALRFPGAVNVGDIAEVDWSEFSGRPDIICGGFPCQDISLAGKGAGIADGTRSGLWRFYADAIRTLRPRLVLVENVSALTSRGLDRVLGDLAACGYDAEWDCIPAAAIGAPHRRDRIFLIAYPNSDGVWQQQVSERRSGNAAVVAPDGQSADVAHSKSSEPGQSSQWARWPHPGGGSRDRGGHQGTRSVEDVAHSNSEYVRGEPGSLDGETRAREGEGSERQRVRVDAGDGGSGGGIATDHFVPQSTDAEAVFGSAEFGNEPHGNPSGPGDVAHPNSGGLEECQERDGEPIQPGQQAPLGGDVDGRGDDVADTSGAGFADDQGSSQGPKRPRSGAPDGYGWSGRGNENWSVEPDVGRVAHGVPNRVDRLKCLGNAVVPQVAEHVARIALDRVDLFT